MSRRAVAVVIVATIALGVASRLWPIGIAIWDKSVGDVAYAILVGLLVLLVRPRMKPLSLAIVSIAICFAIETFQLTGIPARAPRPIQLVLGTLFTWHDMVCYAIGGCLLALSLRAASGARPST